MNDWIPWNGGKCPVADSTPIEGRMRAVFQKDGEDRHHSFRTVMPQMFNWAHGNGDADDDIIAYRVILHPFAN